MYRLLFDQKSKWLLIIALILVGAGFMTKNVISYPPECSPGPPVKEKAIQKS